MYFMSSCYFEPCKLTFFFIPMYMIYSKISGIKAILIVLKYMGISNYSLLKISGYVQTRPKDCMVSHEFF